MKLINHRVITVGYLLIFITSIGGCKGVAEDKNSNKYQVQSLPILDINFEDNLIIPVKINNKSYNFLVDTGSSVTAINKNLAKEVSEPFTQNELPKLYQIDFSNINSVNGVVENEVFTLIKPVPFFIGSKIIRDNDVWVAIDTNLLSQSLGVDIDGIIGIDTIRKMNWLIDNQKKRLILSDDASSAAEWQQCTGYDDSYNLSPQISLTYADDVNISFRLDTGARDSYVGKEFIESAKKQKNGIFTDSPNAIQADFKGFYQTPFYILSKLKFDKFPLGELEVTETITDKYALGMNFLSRFTRYSFIPSRMMFCYDFSSIERYGLASQREISIRYMDNNIEIFYNADKELENTGLRNGDILLKINDVTYLPESIDKVRKIIRITPRGKLNLKIQRDNKNIIVQL